MATKPSTKSKPSAKAAAKKAPAAKAVKALAPQTRTTGSLFGHITPLNKTIGIPANGVAADYPATPGGGEMPPVTIDLSAAVPNGARLDDIWCEPIGNIVDLTKFKTIKLDVTGDETAVITLHLDTPARVRIRIHASYTPK